MTTALTQQSQGASLQHTLGSAWPKILIGVLAIIYLALAIAALPVGILGILGAAAVAVAFGMQDPKGRLAAPVLVVGVIPFAVVTWWSVITPLTAIAMLAIGVPQLLRKPSEPVLDLR